MLVRMRFYLLDRIESMVPGKSLTAVKCWTLSEDVFNDHFPGFPVVPGTLQLESMAQALGILAEESYRLRPATEGGEAGAEVYSLVTIMHKAKFRKLILPGDRAIIQAELRSLDSVSATGVVTTAVEGEIRSTVELTLGFLPRNAVPSARLREQRTEFLQVLGQKDWLEERLPARRSPGTSEPTTN